MYLIYIDEYGTSSGRLDNPDEPFFSLNAAIIKEENWTALEQEVLSLQRQAIEEINGTNKPIAKPFEFHAVELLQGKGNFTGLNVERQQHYTTELLKIANNNEVYYFGVGVEKKIIHNAFKYYMREYEETNSKEITEVNALARKRLSPYSQTFCFLIASLNKWLTIKGERGLLIMDENTQYSKLAELGSYAFARTTTDSLTNIIAAPFFGDSKIHIPLQIADMYSYIDGRKSVARLRGKDVKPEIVNVWLSNYIEPYTIKTTGELLGTEIVDMTIAIVEEMWPAKFPNPILQEYCDTLTRTLIVTSGID